MLADLVAVIKRSAVVTAPAAVFLVPLASVYFWLGHGLGGGFWAAFTAWFAIAALMTLGTIVLHQRESRQH